MPKILAIDDKKDNLITISALLRNMIPGCEVITALSGEEGIKKAMAESPDTILLDIKMPGMDGYETCGRLRECKATKHIPIIMVTAIKPDTESYIKGLEIGADAFLAKPIDGYVLGAQVKTALRIKKAEDDLRAERDHLEETVAERTRELHESEVKYRLIFENIPMGILNFNEKGAITACNDQLVKIIGSTLKVLVGLNMLNLPDEDLVSVVAMALNGKPGYYEDEYHSVTANKVTPVRILFAPITSEEGEFIGGVGIVEDITERKHAEDRIKRSLREKETLLAEIHHRVKNNMQIIISLLSLQSRDIEDERTLSMVKNCEDHIRSMSLVHEKLYLSEDLSRIDFHDYIEDLSSRLFQAYEVDSRVVSFSSHIKDVSFSIETAIPMGLIINELISNALKHAFPENRRGSIAIEFTQDTKTDEYTLTVTDDGVGFPEGVDYQNPETFGLQLAEMLTEQFNGTMELDRSRGTSFKMIFKEQKYRKRV